MINKVVQICGYVLIKAIGPLGTLGTEKKIKVHRFTNNVQGLQKVVVKDFS